MRTGLIYLFLILSGNLVLAQVKQEVITKVDTYPFRFNHYEQLSKRVMADFEGDYDRAAAIYTWVARNIQYDAKAFFSGRTIKSVRYSYRNEAEKIQKEQALREELAMETLKKKRAVCQGYSELFRLVCRACGIRCEVISGYSRTGVSDIGQSKPKADHAWNAIIIDNAWLFVDATWGAGHVNYKTKQFVPDFTAAYFAVDADMFTYNHFPEEPAWNYTKLSLKDFSEQPLVYHSFFGKGFELVSRQGKITKARKGQIVIELKATSDKQHTFYYAFRDMKYMQPARIDVKGKLHVLTIDVGNRRSAYVDIIIDDETVLTYQLQLR
ncbi:hypothetical protein KDU71_20265 [Carboxylicivirga sediminis]|uniref:Transglutaminase-like domain-containing protein n=1 Tax=Carboxylicivirga sediminis TaxID=2006564 RepID=A0A941F716_9BACT|nr:transglutaminase domain-containing protein [Carboxylicivirga sediminis]MBR8537918.1 hypothetical protein [Carboxylicivirga sediminis]